MTRVAIVHDYLTQRGGAERVVLEIAAAFPGAPLHTALYDPDGTFGGYRHLDVRTGPLDRWAVLRRRHRLAFPLLAPAFSRTEVDADVVLCSSSGWAHGVRTAGRKVVYCYTPARWLYQGERYLRGSGPAARAALAALAAPLRRWDVAAAASAHAYLAVSTAVRDRIRAAYGRDAEVLHPPVSVDPAGAAEPVAGLERGFVLCVSRLLAYKNVDAVVAAAALDPGRPWVVAGDGPLRDGLRRAAPRNALVLGRVTEAQLRWLYANAALAVTASHEDFGLVPVEAAAFGTATAALDWGGHRDTIVPGATGILFPRPEPALVVAAVRHGLQTSWDPAVLRAHAARFSPSRFRDRLAEVVAAAAPAQAAAAPAR